MSNPLVTYINDTSEHRSISNGHSHKQHKLRTERGKCDRREAKKAEVTERSPWFTPSFKQKEEEITKPELKSMVTLVLRERKQTSACVNTRSGRTRDDATRGKNENSERTHRTDARRR